MGSDLIQFAPGPDLDNADSPWTVGEGRPPQHQFKGYSLDEKRRPKFNYQFADISVEDYSIDILDSSKRPFIRRTLTLRSASSNPKDVVFKAATGKTITLEGNDVFLVDNALRIRVDQNNKASTVDRVSGMQLRIPLQIDDKPLTLMLEYVW